MTPAGWLISGMTLAASLLGPSAGMAEQRPTADQSPPTASDQRADSRLVERGRETARQRRERVRLTFPPAKR